MYGMFLSEFLHKLIEQNCKKYFLSFLLHASTFYCLIAFEIWPKSSPPFPSYLSLISKPEKEIVIGRVCEKIFFSYSSSFGTRC